MISGHSTCNTLASTAMISRLCVSVILLLIGSTYKFHSRLGLSLPLAAAQKANDEWLTTMIPPNYRRFQAPNYNKTVANTNDRQKTAKALLIFAYAIPKFVTKISMKTMEFEVDMEVLVEWYDHRLNLPSEDTIGDGETTLPQTMSEKIWYPTISLDNCKGDGLLINPPEGGLTGTVGVGKLYTEAQILNTVGIRVRYRKIFLFTCDLDFSAYPFDVQRCEIQLSWDYEILTPLELKLNVHSIYGGNRRLVPVPPGFLLTSFTIEIHASVESNNDTIFESRSATFVFQRIFSQYLMVIFLPSALIVILSWLSFWLDVATSAPRVALGLTTLLTLATQNNAAQKDLPPVAKVKALDIWMFTCMFMVFASLIEFGFANFWEKLNKRRTEKGPPVLVNTQIHPDKEQLIKSKEQRNRMVSMKRICSRCCNLLCRNPTTGKTDYMARIAFPLTFLIFNVWFWCRYYPSDQ